ncbi:squalene/phytoene synthase family protein [Sphingomonas koreensis]
MIAEPERRMILSYAPSVAAGQALATLLTLDDKLAETVRTTTEPMLGQIRLQWWHDALARLDDAAPPAEPVLEAVARDVVRDGVTGADTAEIAQAWQAVLQAELDAEALKAFALRGARLFELAGRLAGASPGDPLALAGEGWALADLAGGLSDRGEAATARMIAEEALAEASMAKWSRNGRAMGAMAHLARLDLAGVPFGSPRRTGRALWHRLTGK